MNDVLATGTTYNIESLGEHLRWMKRCEDAGVDDVDFSFGPNAYGYEMIGRVLDACIVLTRFREGSSSQRAQAMLRRRIR